MRTPTQNSPPAFCKQSVYARYRGVSRKTVTVWKAKGLLVLNQYGVVDVAATDKLHLGHFGVLKLAKDR
jgi:hypothetical protein